MDDVIYTIAKIGQRWILLKILQNRNAKGLAIEFADHFFNLFNFHHSIFKYKSFSIVWIEINSYEHHKDAELLMTSFTQLRKSENVVLFKKKLQNRYLYLLYYLYSLLIAVTTS